jgi:predicted dehydrogenase
VSSAISITQKLAVVTRRRVPSYGVYLSKADQGGGALIDSGPHCIDIALYLMNNYKPASCLAVTYDYLGKGLKPFEQGNAMQPWDNTSFSVEDTALGFVKMENGALLYVESAWAMNIDQWDYAQATICGTKAGASIDDGAASGKPFKATVNKVIGGKLADITLDTKYAGKVPMEWVISRPPFILILATGLDALEGKEDVLVKRKRRLQ